MGRLIIVSNRLPFSIDNDGEEWKLRQSSGGLVSAIKSYFESEHLPEDIQEKLWMGVADFPQEEWNKIVEDQYSNDFEIKPLFIDKQLYDDYYNGFSNSVLWPLFHYFSTLAQFSASNSFESYLQVNKKFCKELVSILRPGDILWIHDYQLMLLPQMIRLQRPDATIGFFYIFLFLLMKYIGCCPMNGRNHCYRD